MPALMPITSIPSPPSGVWYLGPIPIRAYALCIIAGVIVAVWLGERRWVARGGKPGQVGDIAIWAVPFGIVGGRLYHVITDNGLYFGPGKNPVAALYIWQGGMGIWGAVVLGGVGAWIGARRAGVKFKPLIDALAPGVVLAQAIGRWGNWFNQELYGRPTNLPWGLEIDPAHRPDPNGPYGQYAQYSTFHPTFLYESLWDIGVAIILIRLDRRFKIGYGRIAALYVAFYSIGRFWIEYLRIDAVEAHNVFGLRLNDWTSIVTILAALGYFWWSHRKHPGREESVFLDGREETPSLSPVEGEASGPDDDPTGAPAESSAPDPADDSADIDR